MSVSDREVSVPRKQVSSVAGRARRLLVAAASLTAGLALLGAPSAAVASTADQAVAYQLDAQHDGDVTGAPITAPLATAWSAPDVFPGPVSYPLIVNGVVYVTARGSSTGTTLYAVSQATGASLWSHSLSSRNWSAPAYDAGQVFTVDGGGIVTAFNAATGAVDWSVQLLGPTSFTSAPTASGGLVYIGGSGGSGGGLFALDENTGYIVWAESVSGGAASSPAVDANGVYVTYSGSQAYAFGPLDGSLLWQDGNGAVASGGATPVVSGSDVFARDANGDAALSTLDGSSAGTFVAGPAPAIGGGEAYMLSTGTLTQVNGSGLGTNGWTFTGDGQLDSAPLVVGGLVFEASASGEVYAINATGGSAGQSAWSANAGTAIAAPAEQSTAQPLTGLAAGEGTLIVPAGSKLVAYVGNNVGSGMPSNTSAPTVAGTAQTGQRIGADVGVWTGLPTGYTYQWQRCNSVGASCVNIAGAVSESYTPTSLDIGSTLLVQVAATNGSGTAAAVPSAATAVVALGPPALLSQPTIAGTTAVQGTLLTASSGTWSNSPTSYSYQWELCDVSYDCSDIPGATSSTYTPQASDVGSLLEVIVTATNAAGPSIDSGYSKFVGPVTAPAAASGGGSPTIAPFAYLLAPSITGTPQVGTLLTANPGEYNTPATFAYQWQTCVGSGFDCANVTGATTQQFTPVANDIGLTLRVVVVATATGHPPITTASMTTAAVTGTVPVVSAAPSAAAALAALGVRLGTTRRITDLIHHGMSALVYCPSACTVSLTLNATAADRGLKGAVGFVGARLRAGQTRALTVAVAHKWNKALAKLKTATFKLVVVVRGASLRRYVDPITIKR